MTLDKTSTERTPLLRSNSADRRDHVSSSRSSNASTIATADTNINDNNNNNKKSNDNDDPSSTSPDQVDLERSPSLDTPPPSSSVKPPNKLKYIVPSVGIGIFLAAANTTIIVSSSAVIGSDLKALNLTSWIATSYFLSLTSFQPLYGKLSDIFGRKACLLFSYFVFGLGTLGCGLSTDMYQLIGARVVQGIGGGGIPTVSSILFSDLVPVRERGVWQGVINILYAAGSASGAGIAGLLDESVGWRWSFLGQVPICILALLAVSFVVREPLKQKIKKENWKAKLYRVDFLGAAVLVLATFALLVGMDRGSNNSWTAPESYGSLITASVLFIAFVVIEGKVAREPFAPGHIIFERTMFSTYMCYLFSFGSWFSVLYYLPLFYQAVDGFGPKGAAIRMLPAIFASVSGSLFGGFLMKRIGKYYWLTVSAYGSMVSGIFMMLLFLGLIENSTWGISIGSTIGAFGNGIGMTTCLIALIANAAPEDQAVATACSYLFRSLGSTIGVSLSSTVIQQVLKSSLERKLGNGKEAVEIVDQVRQSLEYLKKLDPATRGVVRVAYGEAVRRGFVLMLVASSGAFVFSWFLREKKLNR